MKNILIYVKSILIPLILGAAVGFITSDYMDYTMLIKPSFAPPGYLFPIVWTILYILMGTSYGILKSKKKTDGKVDKLYYTQLFVNLFWSIIFFVFEWRLIAYLWILLLIILVVSMIKEFYERNRASGLIQIPYLIWIVFASFLNLSLYLLNR